MAQVLDLLETEANIRFCLANEQHPSPNADEARFLLVEFIARRPLPDKGKPTVRWGRKATDQARGLMAGPPKEGRM